MTTTMTRRGFVAGGASFVIAGSMATAAFADEIAWDYEADAIVVGTGPAGLSAAANAARNGASVIAIDCNDKIGGKGILAGGNLGIGGGTRMQIEAGYYEDADIIYEDRTLYNFRDDDTMTVKDIDGGEHTVGKWRRIAGCEDGPGMARAFADRSLDTWNWLDELGCPFIQANVSKKSQVYRGSRYFTTTEARPVDRDNPSGMNAGGAGLCWPMYDDAVAHGAEFILNCRMTGIVRENGAQSGRVLGIQAELDGKPVYMKANKGVFLGTGSWNASKKLKVLFNPMLLKYPHVSGEPYVWNNGDGIEIAIGAGAAIATDRGCDWHGWHRHLGTRWHSILPPYGPLGAGENPDMSTLIFVNAEGKRFMDEETELEGPAWCGGNPPFFFAQLCANQTADEDGPIVWVVMDQVGYDALGTDCIPGETVQEDMFATAETIAELAELIGVPTDALQETVASYNACVAAGEDTEFGKKEMSMTIENAPFYALKWGIQKHNTLGGVMIDPDAKVLNWDGEWIEGLYAAGEVAGNMDLIGLSKPIVFGRIAGENMAK